MSLIKLNLIELDRNLSLLTNAAALFSEYLDRCLQGKKDFQVRHLEAFVEQLDEYIHSIYNQIVAEEELDDSIHPIYNQIGDENGE